MQTTACGNPAKNIKLIELTRLLLVHNDFNNNLIHNQKVNNKLKTKPMLNLGGRKGSPPSNPIHPLLCLPRERIASRPVRVILLSHAACSAECAIALNPTLPLRV